MDRKKGRQSTSVKRARAHYDAGRHHERERADSPGSTDAHAGDAAVGGRFSLGELTAAADVSVRTVRYYIAEGLLPPPEGAGPGSAYSGGHLDRLRLIQRLKEAYLPLKEIRRRLAGLDDDEVRARLAVGEELMGEDFLPSSDPSLAGARDYLALLETRERYHTAPLGLAMSPPTAPAPAPPAEASPMPMKRDQPRPTAAMAPALRPPAEPPRDVGARQGQDVERDQALWHRIPLGDEAELVISERVYSRHRDRIDWLVRWARKVFG